MILQYVICFKTLTFSEKVVYLKIETSTFKRNINPFSHNRMIIANIRISQSNNIKIDYDNVFAVISKLTITLSIMRPFVNTQFLIDLRDALTKDKLTNYESILLRTKITLPIMEHAIKIPTFLTSTM